MSYECEEAKLSTKEIAEIHRNMESKGLTHIFCQACSEEMKPEQARRNSTGLIICRPCYLCNVRHRQPKLKSTKRLKKISLGILPVLMSLCAFISLNHS